MHISRQLPELTYIHTYIHVLLWLALARHTGSTPDLSKKRIGYWENILGTLIRKKKKCVLMLEWISTCPLTHATWKPRIALIHSVLERNSLFFWFSELSYFLPIDLCVSECVCAPTSICMGLSATVSFCGLQSRKFHSSAFPLAILIISQFFLYGQQHLF